MFTSLRRAAALATVVATSAATCALAQETATDPSEPEVTAPEAMPSMDGEDATDQTHGTQPDQSGMMDEGMMSGPMDQATTGQGMMCSEMCSGMMGQGAMEQGMRGEERMEGMRQPDMRGPGMHEHIMKIVFAIADADGDGGLSLNELAAIQERVFEVVDADDDGSVTPEELQTFVGIEPAQMR